MSSVKGHSSVVVTSSCSGPQDRMCLTKDMPDGSVIKITGEWKEVVIN